MSTRPLKVVSSASASVVRGCVVELQGWAPSGEAIVKMPGQAGETYRVAAEHVQDLAR